MSLNRALLFFLAFASSCMGTEVELDLSASSSDNFDVVKLEKGSTTTTRITPKLGVFVTKVKDTPDFVWSPLSNEFRLKSFEIHQRLGHDDLGHLVVSEIPSSSAQAGLETAEKSELSESYAKPEAFSNLFFTKRDSVWYPVSKYHFDVLKEDMSSQDMSLDLHNFSESVVSVTTFPNSVTKYLLLARRLSRVVRVSHNGDLLWSSRNNELFKSAYLSYNSKNKLVLLKLILTTPNATYDPLDEKSTRYYIDRTIYLTQNDSLSWSELTESQYFESLNKLREELDNVFKPSNVHLDLSNLSFTPYVTKSAFTHSGIKITSFKPNKGFRLNFVKDGYTMLWASEDLNRECKDVMLYDFENGSSVLDIRLSPGKPEYKFFKSENHSWSCLSPQDYKHMLHTDEISVALDLSDLDTDVLTMVIHRIDGVPVRVIQPKPGYYFHKVKDLNLDIWDSTRFKKCKKAFYVRLCGYELLSLQLDDPLQLKSSVAYFYKPMDKWVENSEAGHSALLLSVLAKMSFDFDLDLFASSRDLSKDKVDNIFKNLRDDKQKDYMVSFYSKDSIPMVRVYPNFESHLRKITEGSEPIWSTSKGRVAFFDFNCSQQPTIMKVNHSDELGTFHTHFFARVNGKWSECSDKDMEKYVQKMSVVQTDKYFTMDISDVTPNSKYTYYVDYLESPPHGRVNPNRGYHLEKVVDGTETVWYSLNNEKRKGPETLLYACFTPHKDPKFLVIISYGSNYEILFNFYKKLDSPKESLVDGKRWKRLTSVEYYDEMNDFTDEYYTQEEILELTDVFKGVKRDYYTFEDSTFFGLEHYGVLTFTDRVEHVSLYSRGINFYRMHPGQYLKRAILFPSNFPRVISLEIEYKNTLVKRYFTKASYGYYQVTEDEYKQEFEKLLMPSNEVELDLSYFYDLVNKYKSLSYEDKKEETLTSYVSSHLAKKYPEPSTGMTDSHFSYGVYNYYGVDFVALELNSEYMLSRILDGSTLVSATKYFNSPKIYFTLNDPLCLTLLYNSVDSRDLKLLSLVKDGSDWRVVNNRYNHSLQSLLNFAYKPLSVDLFHLFRPQNAVTLNQNPPDFEYKPTILHANPGYELTHLYYNSNLIYSANSQVSQGKLQNVIEVEYYPQLRPQLIHIAYNSSGFVYNKYFSVENKLTRYGNKTTSTISSINVFDYHKLLSHLKDVNEFFLDVSVSNSTPHYILSTQPLPNSPQLSYNKEFTYSEYYLVTPCPNHQLVVLKDGDKIIWEADDELVTSVLLYPKLHPTLAMVYYKAGGSDSRMDVKRYRYLTSIDSWLEISEEIALDMLNLNNDKLTNFTVDLEDFDNYPVSRDQSVLAKNFTLQRKKIYGLLFTFVKPTYLTDLVEVRHKGQNVFSIYQVYNENDGTFARIGNRILSLEAGPNDDFKLLKVTYLKQFQTHDAYFKKTDNGVWEKIQSVDYWKIMWLLKKFTLVPVPLYLDDPNPQFFSLVTSRFKSHELTRIVPRDSYRATRVVKNFALLSPSDYPELVSEDKSMQLVFGSDDDYLMYVDLTNHEPHLLRLHYVPKDSLSHVETKHFLLKNKAYEPITQLEYDSLLLSTGHSTNLISYDLDPEYRASSLPKFLSKFKKHKYYEKVETVYDDTFKLVIPTGENEIDSLKYKDELLWKSGLDEFGLLMAYYPAQSPTTVMLKSKNFLKKTVSVQYYNFVTEGEGKEAKGSWIKGDFLENEIFDKDKTTIGYYLPHTNVHTCLNSFTYVRDGVYTTVVVPNNGTTIDGIYQDQSTVWSPKVNDDGFDKVVGHDGKEELVKFYFSPSSNPTVLVVYYRDFDGVVRVKDYVKDFTSWKPSYSKFVSNYIEMLESSYTLNLHHFDESRFNVTNYFLKGFKATILSPLKNTNVLKVLARFNDKDHVVWSRSLHNQLYSVYFSPSDNPKVLFLSHFNKRGFIESKFFYRDPSLGWTAHPKAEYFSFYNKLFELENAFIYHLEDTQSGLPNENYTLENTELYKRTFRVCTPRPFKRMVSVTDNWMQVYDVEEGQEILDVLSTPKKKPEFIVILYKDKDSEIKTLYFRKMTSWVKVTFDLFLKSLDPTLPISESTKSLTLNKAYTDLLNSLPAENGKEPYLDQVRELDTTGYTKFTLDLDKCSKCEAYNVKKYSEATVSRVVVRVKRNHLLKEVKQSDLSVWSSTDGNFKDSVVTHVYFAPSDDPKVVTLFFKSENSDPKLVRFVKSDKWTPYHFAPADLTNDFTLFQKTGKIVLDLRHEVLRLSNNLLFKKELMYRDGAHFMQISSRTRSEDVVRVVDGDGKLWDKTDGENFTSLLIFPIANPRFAKITANGSNALYSRKTNGSWYDVSESYYRSQLRSYLLHQTDDFEHVDLSDPLYYEKQSAKFNIFYRTMHNLQFRSVSPTADYQISKVQYDFPNNTSPKVLFETTPNEEVKLVSFSPEHDPKFATVVYNTSAVLIEPSYNFKNSKSRESSPLSGDFSSLAGVQSYVPGYENVELELPFYMSTVTNLYYKDGDDWHITDDASFKAMCMNYSSSLQPKTQPFDVDLEKLTLNNDKFELHHENVAGTSFTKLFPKDGFEVARVYQYNKIVYREGPFQILSISFFPKDKPRFLKVSHKMSQNLVNNYFFVSYYPYGLSQRDYPSFKKELLSYLNSESSNKTALSAVPATDLSSALNKDVSFGLKNELVPELDKEDELNLYSFGQDFHFVLYGVVNKVVESTNGKTSVTVTPGNKFLYYLDPVKNSTTAFSYSYDTNSLEFRNAFRTFSGSLYKLDYYMVVPTKDFDPTRLYHYNNLVFQLNEGCRLESLLHTPGHNPDHMLANYTCSHGFKFSKLYQYAKDKWSEFNDPVLHSKMNNVVKYHLTRLFPESYAEPNFVFGLKEQSKPQFFRIPSPSNDKFFFHGHLKDSRSDVFKYDLVKNLSTLYPSNGDVSLDTFKFFTEGEASFKVVLVDDKNYKVTKLTCNGHTLVDLEVLPPKSTFINDFVFDLSSKNKFPRHYVSEVRTLDDTEYVLVNVNDDAVLTSVVDGNTKVWDPDGDLVTKFVYYPKAEPTNFYAEYRVGELQQFKYLERKGGKWVESSNSDNMLLRVLDSKEPTANVEKVIAGVLLTPPNDPKTLHVMYYENSFDKYASFVKLDNSWTSTNISFTENVSLKLKFVNALLRSNSLYFTGNYAHSKDPDTGFLKYEPTKVLFDSLSTNRWFFVHTTKEGNLVYLPKSNFHLYRVSFGKEHLFSYDLDTKSVNALYLFVEKSNDRDSGKVVKFTVLTTDLNDEKHRFTFARNENNKWNKVSLTTSEVSTVLSSVKETELLSSGKQAEPSTADKTFTNFTHFSDEYSTSLSLLGNVNSSTSHNLFFKYDLENDKMLSFNQPTTNFYSYSEDNLWNNYKVTVVPRGFNGKLVKCAGDLLYDVKSMSSDDSDLITAIYFSPLTKPDLVYLHLTEKSGDVKYKCFKRDATDSSNWYESKSSEPNLQLVKNKLNLALKNSKSLKLEYYTYNVRENFLTDDYSTYRELGHYDYYLNTEMTFENLPIAGFYTHVNKSEDYKVLLPSKDNKVSHVKYGSETLFSLESQFHTVKALLVSPSADPQRLVVLYTDGERDLYTCFSKYFPPSQVIKPSDSTPNKTEAERLFVRPPKMWSEKPLLFFDSFRTMRRIAKALEDFETRFPHLFQPTPVSSQRYSLSLYLSGVFSYQGKSSDFVYFYDPSHNDSAYLFEEDRVVEHKGAFDVVMKNTQTMNYLYLKAHGNYRVNGVFMDSQELLQLDDSEFLLSATVAPAVNPTMMLLLVTDFYQYTYYSYVKKGYKWSFNGFMFTDMLKLKMFRLDALDELSGTKAGFNEFDFDLRSHTHSSHYRLKNYTYNTREFTLANVGKNSKLMKLVDGNLLVWNNSLGSKTRALGFSPPENPTLVCLATENFDFAFYHKTGGVWVQYESMDNVPMLLKHMANPELYKFTLDLGAENSSCDDYELKTTSDDDQAECVVGTVVGDLLYVVDGESQVWTNYLGREVSKFVYSPPKNPTRFALSYDNRGEPLYELLSKTDGKWLQSYPPVGKRNSMLKLLLPESTGLSTNQLEFRFNLNYPNMSNNHYNVEHGSVDGLEYALVSVKENNKLLEVLSNNLKVWKNEDNAKVERFFYYPLKNPSYFALSYKLPGLTQQVYEYFFKSLNTWVHYDDPTMVPSLLFNTLQSQTPQPTKPFVTSSGVIFDLNLDMINEFYKHRFDHYYTLQNNLLFYTFVPRKPHFVFSVTDSFSTVYEKLSNENIDRVSFYPKDDPKLLVLEITTSSDMHSGSTLGLVRKFVKLDKWVVSESGFETRLKSYLESDLDMKRLDLSAVLRAVDEHRTDFEDFTLVKDNINSFEMGILTPKAGKKINRLFDGEEEIWSSIENNCTLDSCQILPLDKPELLSVFTSNNEIKFYSKSEKWHEISKESFNYISSYYSGPTSTLDLFDLTKFEFKHSETKWAFFYPLLNTNVVTKATKTRYDFLQTSLMKVGNLLFGLAQTTADSNVMYVTHKDNEFYNLGSDEVLKELFYYPVNNPTMVSLSLYSKTEPENTVTKCFVLSVDRTWVQVDLEHFKNALDLVVYSSENSHVFYLGNELNDHVLEGDLVDFVFKLDTKPGSFKQFLLVKMSNSDHYHSLLVLKGNRLTEVRDGDQLIFKAQSDHHVLDLYYTLDESDTNLTVKYTCPSKNGSLLGYDYYEKKDGKWNKTKSFTVVPTNNASLLALFKEKKDKNFSYDLSRDTFSSGAFVVSRHSGTRDKNVVLVRDGYSLEKIVDDDFTVYTVPSDHVVDSFTYSPPLEPKYLTLHYSTESQKQLLLHFAKVSGTWRSVQSSPCTSVSFESDLSKGEFVYDLSSGKKSGSEFTVSFENQSDVTFATVVPNEGSTLKRVVDGSKAVWSPNNHETCLKFFFAPFENPTVFGVFVAKDDETLFQYFVKGPDGVWHLTDASGAATGLSATSAPRQKFDFGSFVSKFLTKELVSKDPNVKLSFMTYVFPPQSFLTSLYDRDQLVHESDSRLDFLQLCANANDLYLRLTTEEKGNRTTHYYTARVEPAEVAPTPASGTTATPVRCTKFTFDLKDPKESTLYTMKRCKFYGHEYVKVKVLRHNLLERLTDGNLELWRQEDNKYMTEFGFLPAKNPNHLCLGVYYLADHRVRFTFYFKAHGKWSEYKPGSGQRVPEALLNLVDEKTSLSDFTFDLSLDNRSNTEYELNVDQYEGFRYASLDVLHASFLFQVVDGKQLVWDSKRTKFATRLVYSPPIHPQYLSLAYHPCSSPEYSFEYYSRVDGQWVKSDPINQHLLNHVFSNNYPVLPRASHPLNKFEFNLSEFEMQSDFYTVSKLGNVTLVLLQGFNKLLGVFDKDETVWKNKGSYLVESFSFTPTQFAVHYYYHGELETKMYDKDGETWKERENSPVPIGDLDRVWSKMDKLDFYNNFLQMSLVKVHTKFDLVNEPDVGLYEIKSGFALGLPIRVYNPLPGTHVTFITHNNKLLWQSTAFNEHVKSILSVHHRETADLSDCDARLLQVYVKSRDRVYAKYFKRTDAKDGFKWLPVNETDYKVLYNHYTKLFNEYHKVDNFNTLLVTTESEDDKVDRVKMEKKEFKGLFSSSVSKSHTVHVPLNGTRVNKVQLDDFVFYLQDFNDHFVALDTRFNPDDSLKMVTVVSEKGGDLRQRSFVNDSGKWMECSLLPDEANDLTNQVLYCYKHLDSLKFSKIYKKPYNL